ncbi:MAG: right-handed parallel beta-helix repeat-containing protein [Cyclobacteriaceae bacterium]|nr:right-handed parallel beta-helix repeat-containing protein [Cyclobacteriaceae bacterium]
MLHTIAIKSLRISALFIAAVLFSRCYSVVRQEQKKETATYQTNALAISTSSQSNSCSACTYVVPLRQHITDGKILGIKPGDIICLQASLKYGPLKFINIHGTEENPIIITNCGGVVNINVPDKRFALKTERSSHFRITGTGDKNNRYGIRLSGSRGIGLTLDLLSTNFEVDHLEVYNIGFAGIMAKTDPSCNDETIRENFTMKNISLHDNFIHDTGGEGFYIGNSFYAKGMNKKECGIRLPHSILGARIYNNTVKNAGWEAIQVGSVIEGAEIFNNIIENYGVRDKANQRGGIQLGEGTGGLCYNNKIINGNGNGMTVLGIGDNVIFNNMIVNAGRNGVFCDERSIIGPGFKFINNTIISPKMDGIKIYADLVEMNVIVNNIIVNPGTYAEYKSNFFKSADDAYVNKLSDNVKINLSHNLFIQELNEVHFSNPDSMDFSITKKSPAVDQGRDVSEFNILFDFNGFPRPYNKIWDIGAFEYAPGNNPSNDHSH